MPRRDIQTRRETAVQLKSRDPKQQHKVAETNRAVGHQFIPESVQHLQQSMGNQVVLQYLRRQKDEDREQDNSNPSLDQQPAVKESEQLAQQSEYPMRTKAKLSPSGGLELDLNHPIHLERYSAKSRAFRHMISEWRGIGQVDLHDHRYAAEEVNMRSDDGRCHLDLGPSFLEQLSQSQNPESREGQAPLDFESSFDVDLKASLHYRSNDARLQDNDLELPDSMTDANQSHEGLFLKIELNGIYINRIDGKPERQELSGMLILQGVGDQP